MTSYRPLKNVRSEKLGRRPSRSVTPGSPACRPPRHRGTRADVGPANFVYRLSARRFSPGFSGRPERGAPPRYDGENRFVGRRHREDARARSVETPRTAVPDEVRGRRSPGTATLDPTADCRAARQRGGLPIGNSRVGPGVRGFARYRSTSPGAGNDITNVVGVTNECDPCAVGSAAVTRDDVPDFRLPAPAEAYGLIGGRSRVPGLDRRTKFFRIASSARRHRGATATVTHRWFRFRTVRRLNGPRPWAAPRGPGLTRYYF